MTMCVKCGEYSAEVETETTKEELCWPCYCDHNVKENPHEASKHEMAKKIWLKNRKAKT